MSILRFFRATSRLTRTETPQVRRKLHAVGDGADGQVHLVFPGHGLQQVVQRRDAPGQADDAGHRGIASVVPDDLPIPEAQGLEGADLGLRLCHHLLVS